MPQFTVSPGVSVTEQDQTLTVPATPSNVGAIAGVFGWGPATLPTMIGSQNQLAAVFGKPVTGFNVETWYSAFNFLAYSQSLYVSRVVDANSWNALATIGGSAPHILFANADAYQNANTMPSNSLYAAKYPGALGNSLQVSVCPSASAFASTSPLPQDSNNTIAISATVGASLVTVTVTNSASSNTAALADATAVSGAFTSGDIIALGNSSIGTQNVQVVSVGSPVVTANGVAVSAIQIANSITLNASYSAARVSRRWQYSYLFNAAPGTSDSVAAKGGAGDEIDVVVIDQDGLFSGTPGAVLESYYDVSRATDGLGYNGLSNYYASVINSQSQYLWWTGDASNATSNTSANMTASTVASPITVSLVGGSDSAAESMVADGNVQQAWAPFINADTYQVNALITGSVNDSGVPVYAITNIAQSRADCVAFTSPPRSSSVAVAGGVLNALLSYRNSLPDSTYAFLDSGYKYQYDMYNDQYVYVPLCGDTAGLFASLPDPWWSPAGLNRGQIKNCIKLAYNPSRSDRDLLYQASVNPVVTFTGQGTVLFGDKTLTSKPSAFSRINVRGLFIAIEKSISTAAKYELFEFNDATTQTAFKNMIVPYLTTVQGNRGITWFNVVCDSTNNTPSVVQNNQFVGLIQVVPNYSINFISLTFSAVNGQVTFNETSGSGAQLQ